MLGGNATAVNPEAEHSYRAGETFLARHRGLQSNECTGNVTPTIMVGNSSSRRWLASCGGCSSR